jgi:soluble lytic murein transglycosylase-like protein
MTRNEVEKLIKEQTERLLKTHPHLLENVDLNEFRSHALTIAFHESRFNENARNKNSTAKGLFQILDGTRRDIEKRIMKINDKSPYDDIWKPDYNTYLGIGYFAHQYKRYKEDWQKAIIAYNLGSWQGQATTVYLRTHNKYFIELFPNGIEIETPDFAGEYYFKFGFK